MRGIKPKERLFGAHAHATSQLRWVDLTDDVGELGTWAKSFGVERLTRPPSNGGFFGSMLGDETLARRRDRCEGVFVNGDAGKIQVWDDGIEKCHQRTHQPTLGLPLLTEKEHVMAGQQGDVDLWNHGIFIAHDARIETIIGGQHACEVG